MLRFPCPPALFCIALTAVSPAAAPSWALQNERLENGPEGELVVRVGDVDNLGFGWDTEDFNPFTGDSTEPHRFPKVIHPEDAPGTDHIMLSSSVTPDSISGDGYSDATERPDNNIVPLEIDLGKLPETIHTVLLQLFVDDFQSPSFGSSFELRLNGQRVPRGELILSKIDQSGPIGKLITFRLEKEFFPLLADGKVTILIDDPKTGVNDGYALDFARVLINPIILYPVEVTVTVVDKETGEPIPGAALNSSVSDALTDASGKAILSNVPAGLVAVEASKEGYLTSANAVDITSKNPRGEVTIELQPLKPGRLSVALSEQHADPGSALIIFDASGSMLQEMNGKRRIDVAKETFNTVVESALPEGIRVALRVFGEGGPDSCESILKIPLAPLDREALTTSISKIQPINLSKTPIAASLKAATADLAEATGSKLVLLLTDGEETCGGDPDAAIAKIRESGLDVRVNIVGFALDNAELKKTFQHLAELGGGTFYDAGDEEDLTESLKSAFATHFQVLDSSGKIAATGIIGGEEIELPAGEYTVTSTAAGGLEKLVTIPNGDSISIVLGEP